MRAPASVLRAAIVAATPAPALAALAVLLSACATVPAPDTGAPWTTGRLSVRVLPHGDQAGHSSSAAFELRGDGRSGELNLNSPLGLRIASARWTTSRAVLNTGDGDREYPNLDALSQQALGEVLPLAALPDWLAGRPWNQAPHQPAQQGFEQLGWQVSLARRGEGLVEAERRSPPVILLRARLDTEEAAAPVNPPTAAPAGASVGAPSPASPAAPGASSPGWPAATPARH